MWFGTIWMPFDWQQWYDTQKDQIERIAICQDTAPKTGRIHWHIACVTKNPKSLRYWIKQFGEQSKWRWYNMTPSRARINVFNYVLGQGKNQKKNALKTVILKINTDGYTIQQGTRKDFYLEWRQNPTISHAMEMWDTDKYCTMISELKHIRNYVALQKTNQHTRDKRRMVMWLWGSTGAGKSYWARQFMAKYQDLTGKPGMNIDLSPTGQISMLNGDEGCVLLDDVKLASIDIQRFLNILDTYPMTMDVKGSAAHYDPDVVIVTCLEHPANIHLKWPRWKDDYQQVARRVTHEISVTKTSPPKYIMNTREYSAEQLMEIALDFVGTEFGKKII